jgi:hypothetical protein
LAENYTKSLPKAIFKKQGLRIENEHNDLDLTRFFGYELAQLAGHGVGGMTIGRKGMTAGAKVLAASAVGLFTQGRSSWTRKRSFRAGWPQRPIDP